MANERTRRQDGVKTVANTIYISKLADKKASFIARHKKTKKHTVLVEILEGNLLKMV